MKQQVTLTRQAVRTPRAAAVAGIIFSVLFTTSMVLIRLALPEELRGTDIADWLQGNTTTISLALTLVPFAGIAFLWFVGVVRSRLGSMEDQFFSTVFFGPTQAEISHGQMPTAPSALLLACAAFVPSPGQQSPDPVVAGLAGGLA